MADYIERGFALDVVKRTIGDYVAAWAEIAHAPAADVAPVVHARWETDEVTGEKYCSDCLERAVFTSGHFYHCADYCPHCGAKMDG